MKRILPLVNCLLIVSLISWVPIWADDSPKKLTPGEWKELEAKWKALNEAGLKAYQAGMLEEAVKAHEEELEINRRLYPKEEYPDGHQKLATSLNNLAFLYKTLGKISDSERLYHDALDMYKRLFKGDHQSIATSLVNLAELHTIQGKLTDAERCSREALDMRKRLFTGDHTQVAFSLSNLATLYKAQGKLAEAEPLFKDALDMLKRLVKGDNPNVAASMNNLASLYSAQGKLAEAEPLYKDAVDMIKRLFKGDHPNIAGGLNNLGYLYAAQGKLAVAESCLKDGLNMYKRLYKGDHPSIAHSLVNLATLYKSQGKLTVAEPLFTDALEMHKRLFKGDHPEIAKSLGNLAVLYVDMDKYAAAEKHSREALAMSRRLTLTFAKQQSVGESLTFIASQPYYRDGYLSITFQQKTDSAGVFAEVWASKGSLARVYEQRQLQARAIATDPKAAKLLAELADTRRRRADLILAPEITNAAVYKKRQEDIQELETKIGKLEQSIRPLLPAVARAEKLVNAAPSELQSLLPADTAVVDFLRYTFFEYDKAKVAKTDNAGVAHYLAFVVTMNKVVRLDLDPAETIDAAVNAWREAITAGKEIPATIPARARELMWEKVRKKLPASIKTVYICPDAALCRVPWGALPGDKPGSILLEDYAVATVPHAPFLLDKLWPQEPLQNTPTNTLVVGGVRYDAVLSSAPDAIASRGDPLMKPGEMLAWPFLPGAAAEATGVVRVAVSKKLSVTTLKDDKATSPAILTALPRARYAHFATHGFFADSSFRSVFQLDEKDYEQSLLGERIGRAANSPLVMTGLVFVGANNPKTPGRGILTGEALIDLDLSGLELAVLSACETGLGDMAGGEGTFGLQRAFHLAGTRDVVASLWKVPDQSTAALMALFYRNLWTLNLSPIESLRQAQLEIYRNPVRIPELSKGFRGKFDEVPGTGGEIKPTKDEKAHPLLWAAFTLSGPGR
ncbi:MAG TPA: CHAT domain-containing tetratricopeptide repeat protein [Gemmata sp.]|jgi:CHAT domain-containing protein/Tfp pilus assembly protein PilF|nr:CHAT domain-containing tetratricopeptide repeat protein [Gemmata sp.]